MLFSGRRGGSKHRTPGAPSEIIRSPRSIHGVWSDLTCRRDPGVPGRRRIGRPSRTPLSAQASVRPSGRTRERWRSSGSTCMSLTSRSRAFVRSGNRGLRRYALPCHDLASDVHIQRISDILPIGYDCQDSRSRSLCPPALQRSDLPPDQIAGASRIANSSEMTLKGPKSSSCDEDHRSKSFLRLRQ